MRAAAVPWPATERKRVPTLEFKGKPFVYSHHLSVPFRELLIDADKSLPGAAGPSLDDNLIIHGDNLEALKALLPRYAGKVDVIYIDPPYNTGNEGWAYNDNVNAPALKEWLGKTVDAEDMERHDKWLSMMWPRLQLLRELMSERGSIWITLDDNEHHTCRMLCDEVFGSENFVANIVWHARKSVQNDTDISTTNVNHVFVYAKERRKSDRRLKPSNVNTWFSAAGFAMRPLAVDAARFDNSDDDPRGPWKLDPFDAPGVRPNLEYDIVNPSTGAVHKPPTGRHWGTEKEKFAELLADGRIMFGRKGTGRPGRKVFLSEKTDFGEVETNWWDGPATTTDGIKELVEIMGQGAFDNPKPSKLIRKVVQHAAGIDALILDSFAGSGTTAQAVLALNKDDGGSRRFIIVEMENYADTLTAERVRRVSKGVPGAKDEALRDGLGGSFTYCELGGVMDLERFFAGDGGAPAWDRLAEYVAYTATGATLNVGEEGADGYAGEAGGFRLHLIYRPDQAWMRSNEAMLDMVTAERIAAAAGGQPVLVFAAGKFMAQKALTGMGLTFCQLPYSIHRILGDGSEGVAGVDAA